LKGRAKEAGRRKLAAPWLKAMVSNALALKALEPKAVVLNTLV
jgi:hypothetical protein